ncbi:molecular chaperone DnaJ [Xanthomonas albilineans]|uniref:molecular chaperone DnaJ n=1 Tax=Xanthomonas albilineans TaxID=29447 RepID=UPI0005F3251E|nr:molecular chaperone DnaJ [Xanthomonas albilineans]
MTKRQDGTRAASGQTLLLRVRAGAGEPRPSPARKRFDTLVERLEKTRLQLRAWHESLPRWEQRYHEQVEPLLQARDMAQVQLVRELDAAYTAYKLSKRDRADLSDAICELAGLLIEEGGFDDLKSVYDRHSEVAFDQQVAESDAMLKSLIGGQFGLTEEELEHVQSPEALYAQIQQRVQAQQAHAAGRAQQRAKGHRAGVRKAVGPALDPRQALRTLYRNLVAALHPDREPDPRQRERKTALMQRLNGAYRDDDLLALLELQMEIGQLDQAGIAAMAEQQIRDYNSMLAAQLRQIEQELAQLVDAFMHRYGLAEARRPQPQCLDALMARLKRQLQEECRDYAEERAAVRQPATFKQWLKWQRAHMQEQARAEAMLDVMFTVERW